MSETTRVPETRIQPGAQHDRAPRRDVRARRSGQIKRRGPAKWLVSVFVGRDASGRRIYKAKRVHGDRRAAERALGEMLQKRDSGTLLRERLTLGQYLDRWLDAAAGPRVGPRTLADYRYLLAKHVRPVLASRWLDSVTALDLQELYGAMQARGLSGRTVVATHSVLRSALRQARDWGLIDSNPAERARPPRREKREQRSLTAEQAEAFRRAAETHPLGLLFLFMLGTGMRPGEALGLRWRDVDLKAGRVHVTQTLVRLGKDGAPGGGSWCFQPPKTAKSRRAIPLPRSLTAALDRHAAAQAALRLRTGPLWRDHDLVFPGLLGQPLDWHNVSQRAFREIAGAAGLPAGFRPYDLRHSCATLLLAAGESPKVVAERLGHSTVTLTLDTYAHVLPTMQERATEHLERLLYGPVR